MWSQHSDHSSDYDKQQYGSVSDDCCLKQILYNYKASYLSNLFRLLNDLLCIRLDVKHKSLDYCVIRQQITLTSGITTISV